jgi:hypothetical protein
MNPKILSWNVRGLNKGDNCLGGEKLTQRMES